MGITGFTRIDTVTVPDRFMAVVTVSDSEGMDPEEIKAVLESDKASLDYLGVRSDSDPLMFPDLYKNIKSVRPKGMKVMLISQGSDPDALDDLVGAGYVHAMDILVDRGITEEQRRCMSILEDNGCRYAITIKAADHDDESVRRMASDCKGCSMFIIRLEKDRPVKKGDLSALTGAAKAVTWNVRAS